MMGTVKSTLSGLLVVRTVKVVEIFHWKLAIFHYFVMLSILGYVLGYAIIYSKGYQSRGPVVGEVNAKAKGNSYYLLPNGSYQIWDEYDAIYPAKEENTLFITTNWLKTENQQRSKCGWPIKKPSENCTIIGCPASGTSLGYGISTGICQPITGECEIQAWCPLERDVLQNNILRGIQNFTIFPKTSVIFPRFQVPQLTNAKGKQPEMGVNLFTIEEMLNRAGTNYSQVALQGAIIFVNIDWQCNFDQDPQNCSPTISFTRVDDPNSFSVGYNFRYTKSFQVPANGTFTEFRELNKVYGIRFVFLTSGSAGKFDIVELLKNIGSGLALLGIATVLTDLVILYVAPSRDRYKDHKFERMNSTIGETSPLISPSASSV